MTRSKDSRVHQPPVTNLNARRSGTARGWLFIGLAATAAGCGDSDTIIADVELGTVEVSVNGLLPGFQSAGSAVVSGSTFSGTVELPAGVSTDARDVPIGPYHVLYDPPDGYTMAPGSLNEVDVVVARDSISLVTFSILPTSGVLRVKVVGADPGAPNAGNADILRTDISGQTPIAVVVPITTGSIDTDVVAGDFRVTFAPPSGHVMAAGQTTSRNLVVSPDETDSVTFVVQSAPPPATGNVVFRSDFSTGLGTSSAALRDTNMSRPWDAVIGNGSLNAVIPSTGLDFPAANVLHVVADRSGAGTVLAQNVRLASENAYIPIPGVGQSIYYRWYFRVGVPDILDAASGGTPHPIQDGPSGSQTNWMFEMVINQNGSYRPGWNLNNNAFPNNRWALTGTLSKNVTYRVEMQIHRIGTNTYNMHVRIFQGASQILGDDDFANQNGTGNATLASNPTLTFSDINRLAGFQAGNNGPGWNNIAAGAYPFTMFYQGAFAICRNDWCGAYTGSN